MGNIFMSCYKLPKNKKYDYSDMDEYYSLSKLTDTILKYPNIFYSTIIKVENHLNDDSLSEIIAVVPDDIYLGVIGKQIDFHIDEIYIVRKIVPPDEVYLRHNNKNIFKGDETTKFYFI